MRHIMTAGVLACALALTAACGGESATDDTTTTTETTSTPSETATTEASPSEEGSTEEPEPEGTVVEMTFEHGHVTPNGDRVEATAGEPITFVIDADAPGELHVHSAAGTMIAFGPGVSEHTFTVDRPGIVEVELHDPPLIVVQLEVR
jgi:glucose/arabinose dehydrogenase